MNIASKDHHQPPPQFFVNQKRGEINELRSLLKTLPPDNDEVPQNRARRREVLKRLISYMTLGIDVSPLFPDVVLASATTDPVQKKLLVLYLSNYAESNAELSILAINALQKDLQDVDPRIRGLALKALTSLRVETVLEYSEKAVRDGLQDPSSYVRRTALIGVLKLLSAPWSSAAISPASKQEFLSAVRKNLQSVDPQLFINALLVLNEVEGGFTADRRTVVQLFNKMQNCDVFGRTLILSLLSEYTPRNAQESVGLLDALESQLMLASTSTILSTLKVMLMIARAHLAASGTALTEDEEGIDDWTEFSLVKKCVQRALPALLTLLSSTSVENSFVVLTCVRHLVSLGPNMARFFAPHWGILIPRFSDKNYNKIERLKILDLIVDESNWEDIHGGISIFLSPPSAVDEEVLRLSVKVLGDIALKIPTAAKQIAEELLDMYDLVIPHVSSAVLPVLASMMAKYSQLAEDFIPNMNFPIGLEELDLEALSALIWLTGEFAHLAAAYAPTLLKNVIEIVLKDLDSYDEQSYRPSSPTQVESDAVVGEEVIQMKQALLKDLLIACCKALFIDPDTMKDILGSLLEQMARRVQILAPDVLDRFLTVLRLIARRRELFQSIYDPGEREAHSKLVSWLTKNSSSQVLPSQSLTGLSGFNSVSSVAPVGCFSLPFGKMCM